MTIELSVIMPAFNCEDTIEEAVTSVLKQKTTFSYEIIIVDDRSTDGTSSVIESLAERYPTVVPVFHEENRGGGAARNTAVQYAHGDLIFCLDGDDLLEETVLQKLVTCQKEKACDGVGVAISRKFIHPNPGKIKFINTFSHCGEMIPPESLLDGSDCALYSTFLITRKAFEMIGGYPTEHGFDTQGLAFRFLLNGLNAYVCPETIYLHRVEQHESYYLREMNTGKINRNWFYIFEEFLFLFNRQLQDLILSFDLDPDSDRNPSSLINAVRQAPSGFFREDFKLLIQGGKRKALSVLQNEDAAITQFCIANQLKMEGKLDEALNTYRYAVQLGFSHPVVYLRILDTIRLMTGQEKPVIDVLSNLNRQFVANKNRLSDLLAQTFAAVRSKARWEKLVNKLIK